MGIPSSQVCAGWVKDELVSTNWIRLYDFCFDIVQARITRMSDGELHEYLEQHVPYIAEHLRDEASEWQVDGKVPIFEIDQEPTPYIRACAQLILPLLRKLRRIDPFSFEDVCKQILQKLGADAKTTQQTFDGGIDFFGTGLKIVQVELGVPLACGALVIGQAKRYKVGNNISETQVREFVGAAVLRRHQILSEKLIGPLAPCLYAFWTTSDFDANAKKYARATGVWYMDGGTLANYIRHLGFEDAILELPDKVS